MSVNKQLTFKTDALINYATQIGIKDLVLYPYEPKYKNDLNLLEQIERQRSDKSEYSQLSSIGDELAYHSIERNCPQCSKLGYHNDAFNFKWIKKCPIHDLQLTEKCPECSKFWPSVPQLINNKCDVCGLGIKPLKAIKHSDFSHAGYEVLNTINLIVSRYSQRVGTINTVVLEEYKKNFSIYRQHNSIDNELFLSFALALGVVQKKEHCLLEAAGFKFQKTTSIEGIARKIFVSSDTPKINNTPFNIMKAEFDNRLKLCFNKLIHASHEIGSCTDLDLSCHCCATWYLWSAISNNSFNIISKKETKLTPEEVLDFYFHPVSSIEQLIKCQNALLSDLFKNFLFFLPLEIQLFLYEIDLWCLVDNCFQYVKKFHEIKKNNPQITWPELINSIDVDIEHHERIDLPMNIYADEKNVKIIYPSSLESSNQFIKSNAIFRLAINEHMTFKKKFYQYLINFLNNIWRSNYNLKNLEFESLVYLKDRFVEKHYRSYKKEFHSLYYALQYDDERNFKDISYYYAGTKLSEKLKRSIFHPKYNHSNFTYT